MKRIYVILFTSIILLTLNSCSKEKKLETIEKVAMVTDSGSIDDKSFNQGTWEGLLDAKDKLGVEVKYLQPAGDTRADYMKEIDDLVNADYGLIVIPGFKFETTVFKAQTKYPDIKFVLIDGSPHSGDYNNIIKENTVSVFFAEHEAGFIAGVAAALEIEKGKFGFIGGMEIPPVQKFNWGFQQGVDYANKNLGTRIEITEEHIVYQGTFSDTAAGQKLAAQMYDEGIDVIFCAAGGVGVGAINEAKYRTLSGNKRWIVGVDVDQYQEGIYRSKKSVVLTSAIKRIDYATYQMIDANLVDSFPGGKALLFDTMNNGVGIPKKNPNLSKDVISRVNQVYKMIQSGRISVADSQEGGSKLWNTL